MGRRKPSLLLGIQEGLFLMPQIPKPVPVIALSSLVFMQAELATPAPNGTELGDEALQAERDCKQWEGGLLLPFPMHCQGL